jgi:ribosomal protein L11 methyltransferase
MILWQKQASAAWLAANELRLEEIGSCDLAVISRPGRVRSLIQVTCRSRSKAEKLVREFGGVVRPLPRNWSEIAQAQKAHAPIRIGRRLEIVSEPAHSPKARGKVQLVIAAVGAFGTGEHATTAMALRLLEETTRNFPRGWRMLDAGMGTGILALAARRLGAGEVLGLDNDSRAVAHARENARRNQITRAKFVSSDLLQWQPRLRYEVITANLFSELLIAALPIFRRALHARGRLILSGILRTQESVVVRAMRPARFEVLRVRRRGKWIALLVRRTAPR